MVGDRQTSALMLHNSGSFPCRLRLAMQDVSLALDGGHGGAATPPYRFLVGRTCRSALNSRKRAQRCLRLRRPETNLLRPGPTNTIKDLQSSRLMWLKGWLFVVIGLVSAALVILESPAARTPCSSR